MDFGWTEDLATGIDAIDSQHQELCACIQALVDQAEGDDSREAATSTIDFLQRYVVEHFRAEEGLMAASDYPYTDRHQLMHESFVADFIRIRRAYERGGATPEIIDDIRCNIGQWIHDHIGGVDKKLGTYISK
jgi:hemerythrin